MEAYSLMRECDFLGSHVVTTSATYAPDIWVRVKEPRQVPE